MRKILRSLVYLDVSEKPLAHANLGYAKSDRLLNLAKAETNVLQYILEFYATTGESPAHKLVFDHFDSLQKSEEVTILEEVVAESLHDGATFRAVFDNEVEEQAAQKFTQDCKEGIKIATQGVKLANGQFIKGTDAAIAHIYSAATTVPKNENGKFKPSMKANDQALQDLYEERKANPHQSFGAMTGYAIFDRATNGLRRKHFNILAGSQGHLKSTLMHNMMVNSAVDGGYNPILFTTEEPADDVQLKMIAIHSANPRFNGVGRPLNSQRLLLGALQPPEEAFMKLVKDDLLNNPDHGNIRVIDSSEFTTFGSVMQRTVREDAEEEVDILWVDYITRMPVDAKYARLTLTEGRNETLADAKRFAMSWKQGLGLPVCNPFQVNREGYKRAKDNEGRMDKTALAQYNAAEKEADNIMFIFYDADEAATNEPKAGVMKARWGAVSPDPVNLLIEPDSRRIIDLTAGMGIQTGYAPTASGASGDEVTL